MNSFLSGIYRYRERPDRSPLEDFLSEALCYLLKLLDEEGRTRGALRSLFDIELSVANLRWRTQYVIPAGAGNVSGKRPDIVGTTAEGNAEIVIIENKITAPFMEYYSEDGQQEIQIELYKRYAEDNYALTQVLLITHLTPRPKDWPDRDTKTWQQIYRALNKYGAYLGERSGAAGRFLWELCRFLEDNNMAEVKLALDEIASYSAWKSLRQKIETLGNAAWPLVQSQPHGQPAADRFKNSGFRPTRGFSDLSNKFFGTVFTPDGSKVDDVTCIIFIGVLIDTAYNVITPRIDGVPEYTATLAIWKRPQDFDEEEGHDKALENILSSLKTNENNDIMGWERRIASDVQTRVILISTSIPFSQLYHQDLDWRDQADKFYRTALKGLAGIPESDLNVLYSYSRF